MANGDSLYFNQLGEDFDKFMDDYDVSRRCYLIFEDLLRDFSFEGKNVLEVGCGTGRISGEIVSRKANLTVLDIGDNLVKKVTDEYGCNGIVGDACLLPFQDNSFDVVISSECIEHTPDPLEAVQEMCRVCRRGGVICLTSPNKIWYPVLWLSLKTRIRKFKGNENWLFPRRVCHVMRNSGIHHRVLSGCHLWPFQLKFTRWLLRCLDRNTGRILYPIMINYGIKGVKK